MRYTAFPLHPDIPDDGLALSDLFAGRLDVRAMLDRLDRVAEDLEIPFGHRSHTYNSRRAQELGKWAQQQGRMEDFQDAVYHAYFVEGKNIARLQVLKEVAAAIDLDPAEAERALLQKSFADAVAADWQRARTLGITAVPSMLYNGRRLVGFHPYEKFKRLIDG